VLGNLVEMPAADGVGTVSMTYLDQGHIGALTDAAGVVWKYYYDADGKRRIKVKTAGGAATEPDGQGGVRLVADHSFYFYEGEDLICQQDMGALVARIPGTDDIDESVYEPKFLLLDHLGSTRAELVFTESGGVFSPVIQEYYDLMPYGEVIDPPTSQESVLFTGKPKDIESGLTFFGARYYSDQLCRWPSPDPYMPSADVKLPQSWNRYSFTLNNPLRFIDTNGLDWSDLSAEQRRVFQSYVDQYNKDNKSTMSAEEVYGTLNESQMSTFESVTYALEHTQLYDRQGNSLGTALQQVQGVTGIAGETAGGSGDKQFRIYADLKAGAIEAFAATPGFEKSPNALFGIELLQMYHKGFPNSYRQEREEGVKGMEAGLQPSYSRDKKRSDIDIDYRFGLEHFKPANSDVRAPGNYQKFIDRWPGLRNWWDK